MVYLGLNGQIVLEGGRAYPSQSNPADVMVEAKKIVSFTIRYVYTTPCLLGIKCLYNTMITWYRVFTQHHLLRGMKSLYVTVFYLVLNVKRKLVFHSTEFHGKKNFNEKNISLNIKAPILFNNHQNGTN